MKDYTGTDYLVYENPALTEGWVKAVFIAIIALTLIPALFLISVDLTGAWIMFGLTVFDAALFYYIFPRKYQIYTNRVVIVLGGPFRIKLPLSSIEGVRRSENSSLNYDCLKFASSNKNIVEIKRRKRLRVIISPVDAEAFVEQLNRALGEYAHAGQLVKG